MSANANNPKISHFLRQFTFVETAVLFVVGFGLFLIPQYLRPLWAWEIAPFNARFLGGIYVAAMLPVAMMYMSGRWSPSRVVLRAIFAFTFIVLVVSLYHISRFNLASPSVWIWFALYVGLPASGAYHLWLYRDWPVDHLDRVGEKWSILLRVTGALLGAYGVGLIIQPAEFAALFPWKLDTFHSQLYSATFITGWVMMHSVSKHATHQEFIAVGLSEASFGILSIVGLFVVDARVNKIDFSASNTLAWLAILGVLSVLGLAMVFTGVRARGRAVQ